MARTSSKKARKPRKTKSSRKKHSGKRRYGRSSRKSVEGAIHKMKRGELRSGRSRKKVTSRKQAIAIGLSKARKRGAKVPRQRR